MIPKQLQKPEFRFVLLQGKKPFEKEWQKNGYIFNDSKLINHIKNGGNYGVIGGYGRLRIIDLDNFKLGEQADTKLETFGVQTGSGGRHYYFLSDYDKNHVFKDGAGELRCKNYQVVGTGSTHPNGNKYKIIKDIELAEYTKDEVISIIEPLLKDKVKAKKELDNSRSGVELRKVVKLIENGLAKEEVWEKMKLYSKWVEAPEQYREYTYSKAMEIANSKEEKKKEKNKEIEKTSKFIDKENNLFYEQVYQDGINKFCIYNLEKDCWTFEDNFEIGGVLVTPIDDEEVEKRAVLLPSEPLEYKSDKKLDDDIKEFINRWLDIPEDMLQFSVWNIKRSWVYERFHTLNYLRALGDTGMGKSRFIDTLGSIHYKPINSSGATTPAPVFRIIDKWKGTLILDESDFQKSDESQDIIKIINQGFEKGKFVMRCDENNREKIKFFDPFCPKILGTRKSFTDKAVEARCITQVMGGTNRKDIELNINDKFWKESQELRNKLLLWRFRNYFKIEPEQKVDFDLGDLEPRVKQIVSSFIILFKDDKEQLNNFKIFIQKHQKHIIEERKTSFDGSIIKAIHELIAYDKWKIDCKDIIQEGDLKGYNGKEMNARSLSSKLSALGFKSAKQEKVNGKNKRCIPMEKEHLNKLFKRYGFSEIDDNNKVTPEDEKSEIEKDFGVQNDD